MQVRVDNRVTLDGREAGSALIKRLQQECTHENPDYAAAARRSKWGRAPKAIPQFIQTWARVGEHGYTFPRGRLNDVLAAITAVTGQAATVVHDKCLGSNVLIEQLKQQPFRSNVAQRPYQHEQVEVGVENATCLWRAPPGSGKTTSAFFYAVALNLPTLVVVPNQRIFDQWVKRAQKELGLPLERIGRIQGQTRIIRPLTIAMAQTLVNCVDEYAWMFGVMIADEVQRHAAATFQRVTDYIRAYYRLGVSADERRSDRKEFLVYDLFGPVRHQVERRLLVENGWLIDAKIVAVPTDFEAAWYEKLDARKKAMTQSQTKLAQLIATNSDRNQLVMALLGRHRDEPTVVMGWRREFATSLHALAIKERHRAGLLLGGQDDKPTTEATLERLDDGRYYVGIGTYQAVGIGVDLPALAVGVLAGPCASNEKGQMQVAQYLGRFERPSDGTDKTGAVVYYLWDRHVFGDRPLKNLRKWFPGRVRVLDGEREVEVGPYLKDRPRQAPSDVKDPLQNELFGSWLDTD